MNTYIAHYTSELKWRLLYILIFFVSITLLYIIEQSTWKDNTINLIYSNKLYLNTILISLHPTDNFMYMILCCVFKSIGWFFIYTTIQIYFFITPIYTKPYWYFFNIKYIALIIYAYIQHTIQKYYIIPEIILFFIEFTGDQAIMYNLDCLKFEIVCYFINIILLSCIILLAQNSKNKKYKKIIHLALWILCSIVCPPEAVFTIMYSLCISLVFEIVSWVYIIYMSVLGLEPKTH